jgi:hypothetical protein
MSMHTLNYCEDLKNAVRVLMKDLLPLIGSHLPAQPAPEPQTLNVMGMHVGAVEMLRRPSWEGRTRLVVTDDVITVEVREGDGWITAWTSDVPSRAAPRREEPRAPVAAAPPPPEVVPDQPPPHTLWPGQILITADGQVTTVK